MRFHTLDSLTSEQLDFVPRERRTTIRRTSIAFMLAMLLVFITAYVPMGLPSHWAPLIALVAMAVLCYHVVVSRQRDIDLIMTTEFQNLLFAQTANLGSGFFMLVRRDGTIVHASKGFEDIFPQFNYADSQALEGVFIEGILRKTDRERIMNAIYSGSTDSLIFPIHNNRYTESKDFVLTVDPLPRPAGFSAVRGRQYLGHRAGSKLLPDILRSTSVDKLDHLLNSLPVGLYTANSLGLLEYANPAFESLLGYEPGQMIDQKLSLHHVFFSLGGKAVTEQYTVSDYTGPITLKTQQGQQMHATLSQKLMLDAQGRVAGVTGSISMVNA